MCEQGAGRRPARRASAHPAASPAHPLPASSAGSSAAALPDPPGGGPRAFDACASLLQFVSPLHAEQEFGGSVRVGGGVGPRLAAGGAAGVVVVVALPVLFLSVAARLRALPRFRLLRPDSPTRHLSASRPPIRAQGSRALQGELRRPHMVSIRCCLSPLHRQAGSQQTEHVGGAASAGARAPTYGQPLLASRTSPGRSDGGPPRGDKRTHLVAEGLLAAGGAPHGACAAADGARLLGGGPAAAPAAAAAAPAGAGRLAPRHGRRRWRRRLPPQLHRTSRDARTRCRISLE